MQAEELCSLKTLRRTATPRSRKERKSTLKANDVEDLTTEELLEGMKRLVFRCREDDPLTDLPLLFIKGRSKRFKVKCSILIEVRVHIIE